MENIVLVLAFLFLAISGMIVLLLVANNIGKEKKKFQKTTVVVVGNVVFW